MIAIINYNFLAFDLLLDSANIDLNAENDFGETALFLTLKSPNPLIVANLISIDLKPLDNQYNLLKSVLFTKSERKPFYKIDLFHLTKKNENIFHYACLYNNGKTDFISLFLNLKGLDINLMSDEGTPLYYAFKYGNTDVIKFLLGKKEIITDNITIFISIYVVFFFLIIFL